jgi:nucleotide-binding universal stress UspA family protein
MMTQVEQSVLQHDHTSTSSIVVGVDIDGRSASAVVWAAEQAEHGSPSLTLVSARRTERAEHEPVGQHDLGALARRLTSRGVHQVEVVGDPVAALIGEAAKADLLVVGSRTMLPAHRIVVGSTSRPVVRWSPVPVVVVPEAWMQPSTATSPVLAGVRPVDDDAVQDDDTDAEVLDFAFTRAAALKVPLVVVSAWQVPHLHAWSPADVNRIRSTYATALRSRLTAWRDRYPDVEVAIRVVAEKPAEAILDMSSIAQLVVVGRHHARSLSGVLGSTTSHLLSHSTRPVAVVPSGSREELLRDLDRQRAVSGGLWSPTF